MLAHLIAFSFLTCAAHGAPLLTDATILKVNKDLKEPAKAFLLNESYYSSLQMEFASYDDNDKSGEALMSTHTDQLMKVTVLPKLDKKDPNFPKDGFNDRRELVFEKMINSSKVAIPGMKKPFETKADLGAFFSSHPLVIRGDGKEAKTVDNLEKIRADALAQIHDQISRTTVLSLLNESILLKTGGNTAPNSGGSCLSALASKKPGDTWKFTQEEQGVKIEYECKFEGWAEFGGKKIGVIKVHSDKQRTLRYQPNGVPGMAETSGDGKIYFAPDSQESIITMDTKIMVEPAEPELGRLKAKGAVIPRNRSNLKHSTHIYPL